MMPLKEQKDTGKETEAKNDSEVSGALSTDEIISLLSKNNHDFIKESEISSNISNLFKKVTPTVLASRKPGSSSENEESKKESSEKDNQHKKSEPDEVEEIKPQIQKKYTEEEAKKLANEYAKQYYNNGYKLGVKKTTEELQKGDKALAVTLKNTTDSIFAITPEFTKEINSAINNLVSNLCKEVLGYEIDKNTSYFQEKIKQLVDSVEGSIRNVQVFLNSKDYESITNYNKEKNLQLSFKILPDTKLERGDVKIKSGAIEIGEIVSNKLKLSTPNQIEVDLDEIKLNSSEHNK